MFLLAGGPGQSATKTFGFDAVSFLFPGYTLVEFDARGTGGSDPIHCPWEVSAAACARELGTDRDVYSTASNVLDLEAVRRALGFSRISLFGVSYGTELALAYARAFPAHVARMVLDSVSSPPSALRTVSEMLRQLPVTLRAFCRHVCAGITTDYGGDVVALANSLARRPLDALVLQPDGRRHRMRLGGVEFLSLALQTDLDPALAAVLPAAVAAARDGNPTPLLRLAEVERPNGQFANTFGISQAVYQATTCNDGPFPWTPETSFAERPLLVRRALARLGKDAFGDLGTWAWQVGNAHSCLRWPVSTVPYLTSASGRYPDVPVLVVAGGFDLRGTLPEARAALARFPRGRLLIVANGAHSAVFGSVSPCVISAIQAWLEGRRIASTCEAERVLEPVGPYPAAGLTGRADSAQLTLSLAKTTLDEAEAMLEVLVLSGTGSAVVAGLDTGRLEASAGGLTLSGYSIVRGVALTGKLALEISSSGTGSFAYAGTLEIGAAGATEGTLTVDGDVLNGTVEGTPVIANQLAPAAASPGAVARAARLWSDWTPGPDTILHVAEAIEGHVSSQYLLSARGVPLVHALTGPLSDLGKIDFIQITHDASSGRSGTVAQPPANTWTYDLCGRGADCSIPGTPSIARGRLVRREALELALYTFKLLPAITSVLVSLPRPAGAAQVLALFARSQFTRELAEPLVRTLALARPPLPESSDPIEKATIDKLTLPYLYTYYLSKDLSPQGSFTLVLTR
jgi:pimeloyl-ACP methyl ester carboxylesterase